MQTVETLNEGLKRAYTLTISAKDISDRVDAEVRKAAPQMKMPGFRPGKVPANLVRKMHGPALAQEALNAAVQDGVQALLAEKQLRPAMQPAVELVEGYEDGKDAELKVTLEVLPDVPAPVIEGITLERLAVEPTEEEIATQLNRLASQQKSFDEAGEDHAAAQGDQVEMDFAGSVDGVAFDGGTGEGMAVEIGSGQLIPGFEDQLVGIKAGESRTLDVTFPDDYGVDTLKGKAAKFEITATAVRTPKEGGPDDAFAKSLGLESLEQLTGLLKGQIEQELNGLTRTHMKRKLLDQLAASHDFPVPPSMVEAEFGQIWQQLEHEATHEADPEAAKAEMEKDRAEYQTIAERRVRLGLLLSQIGQQNGIEVTQAEMNRLMAQAAQQYGPKDRERFIQYVQQDPMAAAQLRAPLYEDKVVDWLFSQAEITDRAVTRAELEEAIEAEDGFASGTHMHSHDDDHDHSGHDHGDHDHAGHDHAGHDHAGAISGEGDTVDAGYGDDAELAPTAPAEPARKAAKKDMAEGDVADAGEGAAAPKPRKRKAKDEA
jgi:trigger factor